MISPIVNADTRVRWLRVLLAVWLSSIALALPQEPPPALESLADALARARAERSAREYSKSRESIAAAIDRALRELADREDDAALSLLDQMGRFAFVSAELRSAERAHRRVLEVRSRTLADDHPDLQKARHRLALTLKDLGDLRAAHELNQKVFDVRSRSVDRDHPDALTALSHLAVTTKLLGDLPKARSMFEDLLERSERTLPDDHADLQVARQNLAATIATLGDYQGARPLFEKVYDVYSRTRADDDRDLQVARGNLAAVLESLGDVRGARELQEKLLESQTRTLPDDSASLQSTRLNLAATLYQLGEFRRAHELAEKVLEVRTRTLPEDHLELQKARAMTATVLQALGDRHRARELHEQVFAVKSRTLPDDHPALQVARTNLGIALHDMGDLQGARALFEKVCEVRSRTLPNDHPELQSARSNLADILRSAGDLRAARALLEEVLASESRTLPDDHLSLQLARGSLALVLRGLGDLEGGRALMEKVVEVHERSLAEDHPTLQLARLNLAMIVRELGELEVARALEVRVLDVYERTLPDDHPSLQRARQNLAVTLKAMGELDSARELEESVLAVDARNLPDDHPDLQAARVNLAETLMASALRTGIVESGTRSRVLSLLEDFARANVATVYEIVLTSPSREADERCARLARFLSIEISYAIGLRGVGPLPELDADVFALSENSRGAAIRSAALVRRASRSADYPRLRAELQAASAALARLVREDTAGEAFLAALQRREAAEDQLIALTRGMSNEAPVDADRIAAALDETQAVVAYRCYTRWDLDDAGSAAREPNEPGDADADDRESLCAIVVRRAEPPKTGAALRVVDLGRLAPIQASIADWRGALGATRGRGVSAESHPASTDLESYGASVRRRIFDPLAPALSGATHVVLALDGALHLVPFDSLPSGREDGRLLGDLVRMEVRATLAELADPPAKPGDSRDLVCLGAVDFGAHEGGSAETAVAAALRADAWSAGFDELPATRGEIDGVAALYTAHVERERAPVELSGSAATKSELIAAAPRARYLHAATHGWFGRESIRSWSDPEPLDNFSGLGARTSGVEQVGGMSPMLLCGLALAGANAAEMAAARASGSITAEEISTLELSGCELAVLSACDTNVGEKRAGQGVASLQRALHMAGARSVITSLWKVPDEATKELMLDFYRRLWVEKKPKHQALWEAKTKLRAAKDERGMPKYTTRDWAAWVLTGDS